MTAVIIAAVLPSLITALTKTTTLPRWLSVVLQVASVLTHHDSDGTLKLPLVVKPVESPKP